WWMGPEFAYAALFLVIVALGETLPTSQVVTRSIVLGRGEPRPLALIGLTENVLAVTLAITLAPLDGLRGVACAFPVPAFLCRGLGYAIYACRTLEVPLARYVYRAWLPALGGAALPGLVLWMAVNVHAPSAWWELIGYTGCYALLFVGVNVPFLLG